MCIRDRISKDQFNEIRPLLYPAIVIDKAGWLYTVAIATSVRTQRRVVIAMHGARRGGLILVHLSRRAIKQKCMHACMHVSKASCR